MALSTPPVSVFPVAGAPITTYTYHVTHEARRALALIRECVEHDRYAVTVHFEQRMAQRGLFWPDVQALIEDAREIRFEGVDDYSRSKWIIDGFTVDAGQVEIVCAIEVDESGPQFITLYWKE